MGVSRATPERSSRDLLGSPGERLRSEAILRLRKSRLMLIISHKERDLHQVVSAALEAEVRVIEVPLLTDAQPLAELVAAAPVCLIGAGEVLSAGQAWAAVEAGARFVASPAFSSEIAAVCEAADVATIAVVPDASGGHEAATIRPDFVRYRKWLNAEHQGLSNMMVECEPTDLGGVEAVSRSGIGLLAVRQELLHAKSLEELRFSLRALTNRL